MIIINLIVIKIQKVLILFFLELTYRTVSKYKFESVVM
jgi:hypothetical protein